jgi:hypothetical protein
MDQIHDTFYSEKEIAIEPDLDLRKSTDKALPAPPKTPKRVMMKYRFSAVFPIAFAVASCVLSILVVVAGQGTDMFNGQYLVAVQRPLRLRTFIICISEQYAPGRLSTAQTESPKA